MGAAVSVQAYLGAISNPQRRADAVSLFKIMYSAAGVVPEMWGTSIVGFGKLHYTTALGQQEEIMAVGFAAQAEGLMLYGLTTYPPNLKRLADIGPHTTKRGCVYITDMSTIDAELLGRVIATAYAVRIAAAG